jgi:Ca2+-binding EF-hand superfamily protein
MFDLDGNGNIDLEEFAQLQTIIRSRSALGQRHKDTYMTGSVIRHNSSLEEHFFGHDRKGLLTVDKFIAFQKQLQEEVIKMEFEYCNVRTRETDGVRCISEMSFCQMILAYAGFPAAKNKKMLKNITNAYGDSTVGIELKEYESFFQVLRSINEIDTALKFYAIAGASVDKGIFLFNFEP